MLGDLSAKYESNGDPACISDGYGDHGGKSYGAYQFSSNAGTLADFVKWVQYKYPWLGNPLAAQPLCSDGFDAAWREVANESYYDFLTAQHEYIESRFYAPAVQALADAGWHIEKHNDVMPDVVWSRAVQYGPGEIVNMWTEACRQMWNPQDNDYTGYPNLTYIDDARFDYDLIASIYLRVCSSWEWNNSSLRDNLNERFKSECSEALARI